MNLPELLRAGGVTVAEVAGWEQRARSGSFHPEGGLIHHTAGSAKGVAPSLSVCVDGRVDLPGPLCQIMIDRAAVAHVISVGRCNHAGAGSVSVLDGIRGDRAPRGDARALNMDDDYAGGNASLWGIEIENTGIGEPFTVAVINAAVASAAALCRYHGWTANRWAGHKEWTRRKDDPAFPMPQFRQLVASRLAQHEEDDMTPEQDARLANIEKVLTKFDAEWGPEIRKIAGLDLRVQDIEAKVTK